MFSSHSWSYRDTYQVFADPVAWFEAEDLAALKRATEAVKAVKPISPYPVVHRGIALPREAKSRALPQIHVTQAVASVQGAMLFFIT